jgi:hypothetical protein
MAALSIALIALTGWALLRGRSTSFEPEVYDAALPDSAPMTFVSVGQNGYGLAVTNVSISPDGSFAVYPVATAESSILWWRSLRDSRSHLIPGTEGGESPKISPDGARVAFISSRRVMVAPIAGGTAKELIVAGIPATIQWLSPNQLVLIHSDGNRLTWLDADAGPVKDVAIDRCTLGMLVPETNELLCGLNGVAWTVDIKTNTQHVIYARTQDGTNARSLQGSDFRIVDGRYLVYMSNAGELSAATYDAKTRTVGRSTALISGLRRESAGLGQFAIAQNGTLAYVPGDNVPLVKLVEMQKGKDPVSLPVEANFFQRFDLSRNRRWLAAIVLGDQGQELRIYDLKNGQSFTWLKAISIRHAFWNPDGTKLMTFIRDSAATYIVYGSPWSSTAPDTLMTLRGQGELAEPFDFPDEHTVLLNVSRTGATSRIDPQARPVKPDKLDLQSRFMSVSPGGKLIAYQTFDSRIMVTTFPPRSDRTQIASQGVEPVWLSDSEILYRSGVSWYSSRVNPVTGEPAGTPVLWGKDPRFSDTAGWSNRDAHDGGIIYAQGSPQSSARFIRVIPNWVKQMKAAVDSVNRGQVH